MNEFDEIAWRGRRERHWTMLLVACFVLVMSFVLRMNDEGRVVVGFNSGCPLPETCLSHSLFNVSCPGCGLTRSFVCLAHGDWESSLRMHRIGWILALAIALQFPYRIVSLRRPGKEVLGTLAPRLFGHLLIALLIGNWVFNLVADRLP